MNEGLQISIAGLEVKIRSQPNGLPVRLPSPFSSFSSKAPESDLEILVDSVDSLGRMSGRSIYECSIWSSHRVAGAMVFESYHPPSGRIMARAVSDPDLRRYELSFSEETMSWLSREFNLPSRREVVIAYPLEQLLFIPVLARRDVVLVHACGAVVNGKAMVFAGHSGDGKTTLARLLASEGVELLSDERVAIRKLDGGFVAYGTPWPGEGNVVSPASYPLGGIFILKKSVRHCLRPERASMLSADLISRSIVPYYLPEETSHILSLVQAIAASCRISGLEFCLEPGLPSLLMDLLKGFDPIQVPSPLVHIRLEGIRTLSYCLLSAHC